MQIVTGRGASLFSRTLWPTSVELAEGSVLTKGKLVRRCANTRTLQMDRDIVLRASEDSEDMRCVRPHQYHKIAVVVRPMIYLCLRRTGPLASYPGLNRPDSLNLDAARSNLKFASDTRGKTPVHSVSCPIQSVKLTLEAFTRMDTHPIPVMKKASDHAEETDKRSLSVGNALTVSFFLRFVRGAWSCIRGGLKVHTGSTIERYL